MITLATLDTPLCPMLAGATDRGVCLLEMGSPDRRSRQLNELESLLGCASREGSHPVLDRLGEELGAYFTGDLTSFGVPLDTPGSGWQRRVWDALIAIPYGQTTSYGRLAERLGSPGGARAVGLANGSNRVSILVACHRVIAHNGTLHGYGGGLERKRWLLDHERHHSGAGLFA